ncbi:hypothetical protein HK104_000915 [Borealophlyctis nickersoniae]|nr:hypothetical protein HK104_000915 [Borealophlyctis nickersoniae]
MATTTALPTQRKEGLGFFLLVIIGVVGWFAGHRSTKIDGAIPKWQAEAVAHPTTPSAFQYGLAKCSLLNSTPPAMLVGNPNRTTNPRYPGGKNVATRIVNATLWDGVADTVRTGVDILFVDGVITDVVATGQTVTGEVRVDVEGRFVTPGLVDMHSHAGVGSWPEMEASDDVNEMTEDPTLPQLRSLDGFDPQDPALSIINSGGVTTSLILPGSGNLMGGEAYAIKHLPKASVEDMLLNAGMGENEGRMWRWMKMACGENAKNVYGSKGKMPGSRLGEGWLFRKRFEQARNLLNAQDDWCVAAQAAKSNYGKDAHLFISGRFPEEEAHESLVALLRGDVKLNVHCYETYDLELMIHTAHEFGFNITAFHHALEAWMIPEVLARENISVALFADNWGYKREAYRSSTKAAVVLSESGVEVAFKSDHPVLNSQHLIYEAAKAHHYGLPAHLAIKSVTSVPAKRLGVGWRIGQVASGYDADLVVWNRDPLQLGAHPLQVYTDGIKTFSIPFTNIPDAPTSVSRMQMRDESGAACTGDSEAYTVVNARLYADEETVVQNATVVVKNGSVSCIGTNEECGMWGDLYDLHGGVIVPGIIASTVTLGLQEIAAEDVTKDGLSKGFEPASGGTRAVDGLRVGNSKMLDSAHRAGVLVSVSVPMASGMVKGQSVAFWTGAKYYKEAVIKDVSAVHVTLGNAAKDGSTASNSISGQFGLLRRILLEAIEKDPNVSGNEEASAFFRVIQGEIPLVAEVYEANDIAKFIGLKMEVEKRIGNGAHLNFTVFGGTEAWVVAQDLASASIPVILAPARCTPGTWETRLCRVPGHPTPSSISILHHAGVKVGLSIRENGNARNLMWEAGWAFADAIQDGLIEEKDAIGFVTWNVADAFELGNQGVGRIRVGGKAAFLGYDGNPLALGTKIQVLADRKRVIQTRSRIASRKAAVASEENEAVHAIGTKGRAAALKGKTVQSVGAKKDDAAKKDAAPRALGERAVNPNANVRKRVLGEIAVPSKDVSIALCVILLRHYPMLFLGLSNRDVVVQNKPTKPVTRQSRQALAPRVRNANVDTVVTVEVTKKEVKTEVKAAKGEALVPSKSRAESKTRSQESKPTNEKKHEQERAVKQPEAAAPAPDVTGPVAKKLKVQDWDDLDAEDMCDPCMVAEYAEEIFAYMKELEVATMPNPLYMDDQKELHWGMRSILVDWLIDVHYKFRLLPETLYLSVNIVDRFLSMRVVSMQKLQLVGATAMFIAAKYEEVVAPSVQNFIYVTDGGFTDEEVLRAERYILQVLDFSLQYPQPLTFLRRCSKADRYDIQSRTLAKYLMEISLVDFHFLDQPPSMVAAAALWLARRMLTREEWHANLVHYSGYTQEELLHCAGLMVNYLQRSTKHENLYRKYATRRYTKASIFAAEFIERYEIDELPVPQKAEEGAEPDAKEGRTLETPTRNRTDKSSGFSRRRGRRETGGVAPATVETKGVEQDGFEKGDDGFEERRNEGKVLRKIKKEMLNLGTGKSVGSGEGSQGNIVIKSELGLLDRITNVEVPFTDLGVKPLVAKALAEVFDAHTPTEGQSVLLPAILSDQDVVLKDITGSGKTLGLVMAILSRSYPAFTKLAGRGRETHVMEVSDEDFELPKQKHHFIRYLQAMMIVPTRELAVQCTTWMQSLSPHVSPEHYPKLVQCAINGVDIDQQVLRLRKDQPRFIVGTPQRLLELFEKKAFDVSRLQMLVVDEVDRVVDVPPSRYAPVKQKFNKSVHRLAGDVLVAEIIRVRNKFRRAEQERISSASPSEEIIKDESKLRRLQLVISSATVNNSLRKSLEKREILREPRVLDMCGNLRSPKGLTHECVVVDDDGIVTPIVDDVMLDLDRRLRVVGEDGEAILVDPEDEENSSGTASRTIPDAAEDVLDYIVNRCNEEEVREALVFVHSSVSVRKTVERFRELGVRAERLIEVIDYKAAAGGSEDVDPAEFMAMGAPDYTGSGKAVESEIESASDNFVSDSEDTDEFDSDSESDSELASDAEVAPSSATPSPPTSSTTNPTTTTPFTPFMPTAPASSSSSDPLPSPPHLFVLTEHESRGLDIPHATHVFVLGPPSTPASYLHMAGRTGRMGKKGTVVTVLGGMRFVRRVRDVWRLGRIGVFGMPKVE